MTRVLSSSSSFGARIGLWEKNSPQSTSVSGILGNGNRLSRACLASPWQRLMRLRVLRLDNWWIEEVTERNVMTVFGVGDGNECS